MTSTTITSPGQQEIIDILKAAPKALTSREIFARAKGFEDADAVSKALNYAMKKGVVEREKVGQNTYAYWLASLPPSDSGNTLLRGTDGREEPIPTPVKTVINDALKPCPEIDAVTQEMANQAEIAYHTLSEALGLMPVQLCDMTLTDLADAAAARLEDQPPPADVAIDNDKYLVSNVETIVAELIGEQVRASELQRVIIGLHTLLDQVRHTLDLSPAASSMDILAEIENLSRLTDRAIQIGARDAVQGPYTIISDPRHATGIYETIEDARPHAESLARSSTFGRAAIANIVAEVALVPQWSEK